MFNIGTHKVEKQVSADNNEAFAELYEQFMPKVYRYVTFRIRDEHLAQDLTAAVFEKAFAKFDGFNPQKASFSTWIFTIARNTVIDHYRVYRKYEEVVSDVETKTTAQYPSPEEEAIRAENTRKLRQFISRLNQDRKSVV